MREGKEVERSQIWGMVEGGKQRREGVRRETGEG